MAYINFKLAEEKGLLQDLVLLQAIKQQRTEENSKYIAMFVDDHRLEALETFGLVESIKGTKNMYPFQKLRLSTKGRKVMEEIETPELTENDIIMYEYLRDMYLEDPETKAKRSLGNVKKSKIYCAVLRNRLSLTLHEFYWLCVLFLEEYKYTYVLEYIFFNSNKNRYGKFKDNIEDSPLYQFLEENEDRVKKFWKKKIKKE